MFTFVQEVVAFRICNLSLMSLSVEEPDNNSSIVIQIIEVERARLKFNAIYCNSGYWKESLSFELKKEKILTATPKK